MACNTPSRGAFCLPGTPAHPPFHLGPARSSPCAAPTGWSGVAQPQVVEVHCGDEGWRGPLLLAFALYFAVFAHPLHRVHHLFHFGKGADEGVEHGEAVKA